MIKSTNRTNHLRLASRKEGVWKKQSLKESLGSRWANKVKINAFYKTMKVFFGLACKSTCCYGLPKPKYEPLINHNRSTLKQLYVRTYICCNYMLYMSICCCCKAILAEFRTHSSNNRRLRGSMKKKQKAFTLLEVNVSTGWIRVIISK